MQRSLCHKTSNKATLEYSRMYVQNPLEGGERAVGEGAGAGEGEGEG